MQSHDKGVIRIFCMQNIYVLLYEYYLSQPMSGRHQGHSVAHVEARAPARQSRERRH